MAPHQIHLLLLCIFAVERLGEGWSLVSRLCLSEIVGEGWDLTTMLLFDWAIFALDVASGPGFAIGTFLCLSAANHQRPEPQHPQSPSYDYQKRSRPSSRPRLASSGPSITPTPTPTPPPPPRPRPRSLALRRTTIRWAAEHERSRTVLAAAAAANQACRNVPPARAVACPLPQPPLWAAGISASILGAPPVFSAPAAPPFQEIFAPLAKGVRCGDSLARTVFSAAPPVLSGGCLVPLSVGFSAPAPPSFFGLAGFAAPSAPAAATLFGGDEDVEMEDFGSVLASSCVVGVEAPAQPPLKTFVFGSAAVAGSMPVFSSGGNGTARSR